jgi:hypothetical protein
MSFVAKADIIRREERIIETISHCPLPLPAGAITAEPQDAAALSLGSIPRCFQTMTMLKAMLLGFLARVGF